MESRINYHIRGIFLLGEKNVPPALNKHLTNKIFKKPNKEAMEQVLYYLLPLTDPNCLKTVPWPITTFKEAAEFRNAATLIINGLNGFVYEKSSNMVGKVNSSLLANPGGPIFIYFMYQFCLYIKYCELKKKGINSLNAPLYVDDEYIEKKISLFKGISKSNFNEVNELIFRIDHSIKNTTELAIKYKEIIQVSKQRVKDLKSELLNTEHCDATENEIAESKQKYIDLYDKFEQNKLIAMKCAKLVDIILIIPETYDANIINIKNEELIKNNEKLDLVKLFSTIKNTLNGYMNWCEQLNDERELKDKVLSAQQSVMDMTEQMRCYEKLMKVQSNIIDNLQIENQQLYEEVFTSKCLEKIDHELQSLNRKIPLIFFKTNLTNKPKFASSENGRKSRRSILLHCSKPCAYQTLHIDYINDVYRNLLPNQIKISIQNDMYENNDYSPTLCESNQTILFYNSENDKLQENTIYSVSKCQSLLTIYPAKTDEVNCCKPQIKEDEVTSVSISRKSIENIKQKFNRIKKQAMSTIPHSPQSPF